MVWQGPGQQPLAGPYADGGPIERQYQDRVVIPHWLTVATKSPPCALVALAAVQAARPSPSAQPCLWQGDCAGAQSVLANPVLALVVAWMSLICTLPSHRGRAARPSFVTFGQVCPYLSLNVSSLMARKMMNSIKAMIAGMNVQKKIR